MDIDTVANIFNYSCVNTQLKIISLSKSIRHGIVDTTNGGLVLHINIDIYKIRKNNKPIGNKNSYYLNIFKNIISKVVIYRNDIEDINLFDNNLNSVILNSIYPSEYFHVIDDVLSKNSKICGKNIKNLYIDSFLLEKLDFDNLMIKNIHVRVVHSDKHIMSAFSFFNYFNPLINFNKNMRVENCHVEKFSNEDFKDIVKIINIFTAKNYHILTNIHDSSNIINKVKLFANKSKFTFKLCEKTLDYLKYIKIPISNTKHKIIFDYTNVTTLRFMEQTVEIIDEIIINYNNFINICEFPECKKIWIKNVPKKINYLVNDEIIFPESLEKIKFSFCGKNSYELINVKQNYRYKFRKNVINYLRGNITF